MKLKIRVKRINKNLPLPEVTKKGDWIDLRASKTVVFKAPQARTLRRHTVNGEKLSYRNVDFDLKLIPLGIAMGLPKGFEAVLLARSSTPNKFGVITANSEGVIDNIYCGENDEWKYPAISLRNTTINEGDRICQFRIQLSQKATFFQKLKWALSSGIKIIEVNNLSKINRGGFGSTGVK